MLVAPVLLDIGRVLLPVVTLVIAIAIASLPIAFLINQTIFRIGAIPGAVILGLSAPLTFS